MGVRPALAAAIAALVITPNATVAQLAHEWPDVSGTVELRLPTRFASAGAVVAGRDTVWFHAQLGADAAPATYAYVRRTQRWVRVAPRAMPAPRHSVEYAADTVAIADGIELIVVVEDDTIATHAIRSRRRGRIHSIRKALATAERRPPEATPLDLGSDITADVGEPALSGDSSGAERRDCVAVSRVIRSGRSLWLALGDGVARFGVECRGTGILRYDLAADRLEVIDTRSPYQLTVDGPRLWTLSPPRDGGMDVVQSAARYDPLTKRWTSFELAGTGLASIQALEAEADTLWVAAAEGVGRLDVRSGRWDARYFDLALAGDTIVHALVPEVPETNWDRLAAFAAVEQLGIRRAAAFVTVATDVIRAPMLRAYSAADAQLVDHPANAPFEVDFQEDDVTGLYVTGLDHPALASFVVEMLESPSPHTRRVAAQYLARSGDRKHIPALRRALATTERPHEIPLAVALGQLGDSTGHRHLRRALRGEPARRGAVTTVPDPAYVEAVALLQDAGSVPSLLRLLRDTTVDRAAVVALTRYADRRVWTRTAAEVGAARSRVQRLFLLAVRDDTTAIADPALVADVRELARRATLGGSDPALGAEVLARYGEPADASFVIALLTRDERLYDSALGALVRWTAEGDTLPRGAETTAAERAAVQRWWLEWWRRHGEGFERPAVELRESAWLRWHGRPYRQRPEG